jgi:ubiquinone/menaquinone biosynthesis C-methylase UbiE
METDDLWERMALKYDTEERVDAARIVVQAIRPALQDTQGKTALDYGCGTGLVGLGLIDRFQSIIFTDASVNMIQQVNRKIRDGCLENARTLRCDFLTEVSAGLRADYVIVSQVLLHIRDTRLILSRLYEVINPGGHLIIIDFDWNEAIVSDKVHPGFVQDDLIRLVTQTGFSSASARTFYHGKGIFMNQDASMFLLDAVK